jgi:hypothetical protein
MRANLAWAENGNGSDPLASSPFSGWSQSRPLGESPSRDSIRLAGIGEGGNSRIPVLVRVASRRLDFTTFGGDVLTGNILSL